MLDLRTLLDDIDGDADVFLVAALPVDVLRDFPDIYFCLGREFARDGDDAVTAENFDGRAGKRVLFEASIEDRVGYLVADLVRMGDGDRLRCFCHKCKN